MPATAMLAFFLGEFLWYTTLPELCGNLKNVFLYKVHKATDCPPPKKKEHSFAITLNSDQQRSSEWQEETRKSWLSQVMIFFVLDFVRHWDSYFHAPWDYTTHSNYSFHFLISSADLSFNCIRFLWKSLSADYWPGPKRSIVLTQ